MAAVQITVDNFENEVLKEERIVLIDFWASWCGPCKMLTPIIEELSEQLPQVKICKVNVDEQPFLAEKFKIMSIPTLLVLKGGEVINTAIGVKTKAEIVDILGI